ncbi:nucleotide exchange factor GrpE [Candidatus Saccharibacteria bacterium]|nr:nucleotide exchange factor GrpE [Candidatus Saccharibacteria bacterium]
MKEVKEVKETPKTETEPVDKSAEKIAELTADLQRTRADFENFRKNVEKDRENAKKLSRFSTVSAFLPLLDDLDRAISTYPELKPLEKNFEKTLKSLNLEKIDSKKGTEFNPEFHEAVMTEGEGEKELVSETLRPGYLYEGEVLRAAMVKIALS